MGFSLDCFFNILLVCSRGFPMMIIFCSLPFWVMIIEKYTVRCQITSASFSFWM